MIGEIYGYDFHRTDLYRTKDCAERVNLLVELHTLADKYDFQELSASVAEVFKKHTFTINEDEDPVPLLGELLASISDDSPFMDLAVEWWAHHADEVHYYHNSVGMQEVLDDNPAFAGRLARYQTQSCWVHKCASLLLPRKPKRYVRTDRRCLDCGQDEDDDISYDDDTYDFE